MTPPVLEIADLIRTAGAAFVERNRQWIVDPLEACRSAAGHSAVSYGCARRTSR